MWAELLFPLLCLLITSPYTTPPVPDLLLSSAWNRLVWGTGVMKAVCTLTRWAIFPYSRHICTPSTANLNYQINRFIRNSNLNGARNLFDHNPTAQNVVSWNSLIAGYIKRDQMQQAQVMFDEMPVRDVVSWNTMLSGFNMIKDLSGLYRCFLQMGRAGQTPNEFTFSIVISAVLKSEFDALIPQLHGLILHLGLNSGLFIGSALMKGYTNLGDRAGLLRVFEDIVVKDVTSWNALILGYMDLGNISEAQMAFEMMPEVNIISWTTVVDGYIKNRKLQQARTIFNQMSERNVVCWTAMIKGYVQYGKFVEALELFNLMLKLGTPPNHFTLSIVVDACAGCSSLIMGNQVHLYILKAGIPLDVILFTSLVDMYGKCGDIEAALCIFESMPSKNLVSWNAIIGGYARHGLATRALDEFGRMTKCGFKPDSITLINVLSACGHGGLVEEGERQFYSMGMRYGVKAEMEHYACMVNLYGRAGQPEKARKLIKGMPVAPDVVVWCALLATCGLHSRSELVAFAAEGLENLEQDHPAVYSTLLKINGENGVWGSVTDSRNVMKERRVRKQKAGSWIEFGVK